MERVKLAGETFGVVVGSIASIWAFFKGGVTVLDLYRALKALPKRLEGIEAQFKCNGGSTVMDAITRIEQRQVASEQKNWALTLDSPQGIFETNAKGEYLKVNRTYQKLIARDSQSCLGKNWLLGVHPKDRETVSEEWETALEQRREFFLHFTLVSGARVVGVAHPIFDRETNLTGYIGTITLEGGLYARYPNDDGN